MVELLVELGRVDSIVPPWREDVSWWPEGPSISMEPLMWAMRLLGGAILTYLGYVLWCRVRVSLRGWMGYSRVAGALGLGWWDRWLLWRGARVCGLESAVTLLVCRETLEAYAGEIAAAGERRGGGHAQRARRLAQAVRGVGVRLFG